jgi:hypothetical protein
MNFSTSSYSSITLKKKGKIYKFQNTFKNKIKTNLKVKQDFGCMITKVLHGTESLKSTQLVKKSPPPFMEPEVSLL